MDHQRSHFFVYTFSSAQLLSHVWLLVTPWTAACQAPCPSPTSGAYSNSCPTSQWCQPSYPSVTPSPPTFNLSHHQGLFQRVNSSHQVAQVFLEFQLQHQSFQWTFRTDFLRMDWLDRLAIRGTLKSLLQHHSSKASILHCSAFFIVHFNTWLLEKL